jgi:putative flippase GtrA
VSGSTSGLRAAYDAHGEKLRYLIVGVWNTAFSYGLFWLAIKLFAVPLEQATGTGPKTAALILQWATWVLAVVQSTVTMKYFAFRSKGHVGRQIARAYFIYLPAQGLSSLILWVGMFLGLSAVIAQLFAVFVTTIFSYFGHKYFTFKVPLGVGEVPAEELVEGDDFTGTPREAR